MTSARTFPSLRASSRSYTPGEYPQTVFEALNGAKTVLRYGNKRVNSKLTLKFENISDAEARQIIVFYEDVNSDWDYVSFGDSDALIGTQDSVLREYYREGSPNGTATGLRWRFDGPPSVTSVFPGVSTVSCEFVGCLDGD